MLCLISILAFVGIWSLSPAFREVSLGEFAHELNSHLDQASLLALSTQQTTQVRLTPQGIISPATTSISTPRNVKVSFRFGGGNQNLISFYPSGGNSAGTIELVKYPNRCTITLSVSGARRTEC